MSDDKKSKDYHDRDRVNINEPYEVQYWTKRFNLSRQELENAVRNVGPMVRDIESFIKGKV